MARKRRSYHARPVHPLTHAQVRISAPSARELEHKLAQFERLRDDLRLGHRSAQEVDRSLRRLLYGAITLEGAARAYAARGGLARNTVRNVHTFLSSAAGGLRTREVDTLDVPTLRQWIDKLRASRTLGESSLQLAWRTLRAIVQYATERGWLGAAPWGIWRPKFRPTRTHPREAARTIDELLALLEAAHDLDAVDELRGRRGERLAKIATVVLLGLRSGELAGLRWCDLHESEGTVAVVRQFGGEPLKTGALAYLSARPVLFALLNEHRVKLKRVGLYAPEGPIFPNPRTSREGKPRPYSSGEPLSRFSLRRVIVSSGLPSPALWSCHSLRDTFATLELIGHAGDLPATAKRTRHRSLSSLVRYLRSVDRAPAPPGISIDGPLTSRLLTVTAAQKTPH